MLLLDFSNMTSQLIQKAVETLEKEKTDSRVQTRLDVDSTERVQGYNIGITRAQSLLPQIITGVIEEIEKIAERTLEEMKDPKITYDKDVDITETPDEMWTEMTGIKKGWEAGLRVFLSSLKEVVKE